MVAIGLLVNWSVLDVRISECGHVFVGGVFMGGGIYMDIPCLLPCGQETRAWDQGAVHWDWAGGPRGLLSVAEAAVPQSNPLTSRP